MTATITATGHIAEPRLNFTPKGHTVLNLSVCCTRRTLDKKTNTWSDDGNPLWIEAAFWDDEAETLANTLTKGTKITVQGTLTLTTFTRNDGQQSPSLNLTNARFLGIVPTPNPTTQTTPNTQAWNTTGEQPDDPWRTQNYNEAPF